MRNQDFRNPAHILWLIRQGQASDWQSLCHSVGMDPDERYTAFSMLMDALKSLLEAGLITTNMPLDYSDSIKNVTFAVTPLVAKVQTGLRVSLSQLAATDPSKRLIVESALDQTYSSRYKSDIFVLMPFLPELRPLFDDHIKAVAKKLKMSAARGDDFFTEGNIIDEVWTAIVSAKVIIADCTGRNPNVFYEIGLAHAIGKPVILVTRDQKDVPFDLRHRRYIKYEFTPRGMREFEDVLFKTIRTIQSGDE